MAQLYQQGQGKVPRKELMERIRIAIGAAESEPCPESRETKGKALRKRDSIQVAVDFPTLRDDQAR